VTNRLCATAIDQCTRLLDVVAPSQSGVKCHSYNDSVTSSSRPGAIRSGRPILMGIGGLSARRPALDGAYNSAAMTVGVPAAVIFCFGFLAWEQWWWRRRRRRAFNGRFSHRRLTGAAKLGDLLVGIVARWARRAWS
jgi:hypothetical protein